MSGLYEKQLVALGRALQKVRELEQVDAVTQAVIQYLQDEFDYTLVWLGQYNPKAHTIKGMGGVAPPDGNAVLTQKFVLEPGDLLEQVVVQKRLIGVPTLQDVPKSGPWQAIARKLSLQGTIIFPIRHRDQCLGVAILSSTVWGIPVQSDDKARLSMILGEFGTALYRLETERQQQQTQQPIAALLNLLASIHPLTTVEERLAVLVREAHQFLHGDRTHLYWFSKRKRIFWRWIGQPGDKRQVEPEAETVADYTPAATGLASIRQNQSTLPPISVGAVTGFYQQLLADELVAISEAQSSLQGKTTGALMSQMGGQALLAIPILFQRELLGFLAVTERQSRLWSNDDKQYLRGVGRLAALIAPLQESEQTIQTIRQDQQLAAGICQAICGQEDWKQVLEQCANDVLERFGIKRFLVLSHNEHRATFEIAYQNSPSSRQKQLKSPLSPLNDMDWALLERTQAAIAIEDLDHDLKLMDWREVFVDAGIRSFLACPSTIGNLTNGIVIVADDAPRHWTVSDQTLIQAISQQIGVILRQWHLNHEVEQRQSMHQAVHGSLSTIQETHHLGEMETASMNRVADLMDVPLVVLIPWEPNQDYTMVPKHLVVSNNIRFSINSDASIPIATDALIQWSLQSDEILSLHISQLTTETRQWLDGEEIGQVLAIALRTDPEHYPLGLLLVADVAERFWSNYQIEVLEVVGRQLAWSRRYLMLTEKLTDRKQELEQLNWYKHRSLEYLCWTLSNDLKRLKVLNPPKTTNGISGQNSAGSESMSVTRTQQLIQQMGMHLGRIQPMLKDEQWQVNCTEMTIPLVSLLKRAMARVDPIIQRRQLWTKIHNELNLAIIGDISKTELILHEILAAACRRAPKQSGVDVWCRSIDFDWIELSITDQGTIDSQLLNELHHGQHTDKLAHSLLDSSPGLELSICQRIIQHIGGEFNLYALEDGRILSQMTLRIDNSSNASKGRTTVSGSSQPTSTA